MPDERTKEDKIEAFRQKYPERVAALTAVMLPLMGIHARTKLDAATLQAMAAPHVDAAIAASWGLE